MALSGGQGKDDASKIRRDPTVSDGGAYLPGVVVRMFRKVSTTPMRYPELTQDFVAGATITATLAAMAVIFAFAMVSCHSTLLNPDPVHGGPCGDGNQLSTLCPDGSCAPPGFKCVPQGGWDFDPDQWGPGFHESLLDGGRE